MATRKVTPRTIQRMVTRLQAAMASVYAEAGERREERTNENGTMVVIWRSGRQIRRRGHEEPEGGAKE